MEKVFATGRGMGMTLPHPEAAVDFKDTLFETPLSMSQFVFNQAAVFTSAIFDGYAWFDSTIFQRGRVVRPAPRVPAENRAVDHAYPPAMAEVKTAA